MWSITLFELYSIEVNSFTMKAVVKQETDKGGKKKGKGSKRYGRVTYEVLMSMKGCVFTTRIPVNLSTRWITRF